jgi:hypothetical protein
MGSNSHWNLSSFSFANSCILSFVARVFLNVVPPELSVRIPKGFYPSYPTISTVVLSINDKHTLLVKLFPTICPFGIDGNYNTRIIFSLFDINVKEETCSP